MGNVDESLLSAADIIGNRASHMQPKLFHIVMQAAYLLNLLYALFKC